MHAKQAPRQSLRRGVHGRVMPWRWQDRRVEVERKAPAQQRVLACKYGRIKTRNKTNAD
jgi:hypothetical protein